MLTWIANVCCFFLIVFPGEIWRSIFGTNFMRNWWDSHYR